MVLIRVSLFTYLKLLYMIEHWAGLGKGTVAHKSHDPCFHKKYMEAGVMTFVTHCT